MKGHILRCLVILFAVAIAFGVSLKLGLFWDDYLHFSLLDDPEKSLNDLQFNSYSTDAIPQSMIRDMLPWWFTMEFRFHYFRPVPTLSLALDRVLWGQNLAGMHLTNILLHALCGFLVYGFCLSLGLKPKYALLGGLTATLHLCHLPSVVWLCARDSILGTIFLIGALWFYNEYLKKEESEHRGTHLLLASFLTFLVGVLAKENLTFTPLLMLILAWLRSGGFKAIRSDRKKQLAFLHLLPFFALSGLYTLWYSATDHGVTVGYFLLARAESLGEIIAIMAKNLYLFLFALLLYVPIDAPETHDFLMSWPSLLWVLPFVIFWIGLVIRKHRFFRLSPVLTLFLAWTLLFLITPLWFVPNSRFLYKTAIGYGLFAAGFLQILVDQTASRRWRKAQVGIFITYFIVIPFLMNLGGTALAVKIGSTFHSKLDGDITKMHKESPESSVIFLLNAPDFRPVMLANLVHQFHHPEKNVRICVLGNVKEPPTVRNVTENGFCLYNPEGLLILDVPFTKIPFAPGNETPMPGYRVEQTLVEGGVPREVCISLDKPVDSPDYLFVHFQGEEPRKVSLTPASPSPPRFPSPS